MTSRTVDRAVRTIRRAERAAEAAERAMKPAAGSIERAVRMEFRVSARRLRSRRGPVRGTAARGTLCYLLRALLKWSLPRIGRHVRMCHSSVLTACRCVDAELGGRRFKWDIELVRAAGRAVMRACGWTTAARTG